MAIGVVDGVFFFSSRRRHTRLTCDWSSDVCSSDLGFQKPNSGIFKVALERMQVEPAKAWHVGDSYRADVVGARRVGINGVLIDRSGSDPARAREKHEDANLAVVTDLFELLDMLEIERPALSPA